MTGKAVVPRPPAGLAARGRALWRQIQARYVLDPLEAQLLAELCRTLDACDRMRRELAGGSLVVTGSTGQPRVNPLLGALEAQVKLADRLASSLGVSVPGSAGAGKGAGHQRKAARTRWRRSGNVASVMPIGGGRDAGA